MTTKERLNSVYKLLSKIINKPKSLFLILKDETQHEDYLKKKYNKTEFRSLDINYFLQNKPIDLKNITFLEGSSTVTDLALLKSIAAKFQPCDYLEIGTWRGESIVNVADVEGSKCVSINLSPQEIIKMGLPEKYANQHGCLIKNKQNIEQIYANSLTFDFQTLNQKFDLIFVDGDHKYNAVKSDTQNVFKLLKDEKSIIVWHDYGFDPATPRHSVIAAILDGIPTEEHKYLYHVSNTMCAIYVKHNDIDKYIENKDVTPNKIFSVNLKSEKIGM